jgi:NitT/TauT family transport system substrate-binding protein
MSRRIVLAGVMACVLMLGAAPALHGQGLTTLRVGLLPLQSWAPIFIALEEGHFRRQGIQIEFQQFASAAESIPVLIDGKLDVGAGAVSAAFFNALARGLPVRVVADKGHEASGGRTNAILVRKDLVDSGAVKSIADLRGRRVGINATGSNQHYILVTALKRAGLKGSDVNLVRLPQPSIGAALEGRGLDAGVLGEPQVTLILQRGVVVPLLWYSEVLPVLQIGVIIYGPNLLQRNRPLGVRFMAAYLQGLRQYAQGKTPRNVAIQAKHTQLEPEILRKSYWFPMRADGRVDGISLMKMQDWLFEEGFIDVRVPASQFIDHTFLEDAETLIGR